MVASKNDRRGKPRVEANLAAKITTGERCVEATVKNISESGLLLIVDKAIPEMTLVGLRLALPPSKALDARIAIEIQGAVVRCAKAGKDHPKKYEVAVFMTGIPTEAKLALHDYIQERLQHV